MPKNGDSKEFMLTQYQALSDSFWRNEELGERRVSFLITLATAVITALVALVKVQELDTETFLLPSILSVTALLLLGIVTWRRMLVRNLRTDEYKRGMEIIRSWFETSDSSLQGHCPFPKSLLFLLEAEVFAADLHLVPKVPVEVGSKLKSEFKTKEVQLGDKATIRTIEMGCKWLICGKGECNPWLFWRKLDRYLVRRVKDQLAVYEPRKPSWGGLAATVGVMNSILAGFLAVLLVLGCAHLVNLLLNAFLVGCAPTLNAIFVVCALIAWLCGTIGAIMVQGLLMVRYYDKYDIVVP